MFAIKDFRNGLIVSRYFVDVSNKNPLLFDNIQQAYRYRLDFNLSYMDIIRIEDPEVKIVPKVIFENDYMRIEYLENVIANNGDLKEYYGYEKKD